MAEEERKSLKLRICTNTFGVLPSESERNYEQPNPTMNTEYASATDRKGAVANGKVRQGWFPEDWLNSSEIGTLKRLGTNTTKTLSGSFPRISGAKEFFRSKNGGDAGIPSGNFTRTGTCLTINGSGDVVFGVGVTTSNKARLNERACYDTAIGLMLSFDTADTDYTSGKTMKFNEIYLLYMKRGDSNTTYYSPIVYNNKYANTEEDRSILYDNTPINGQISSDNKDPNWTRLPHVGGSLCAYIPQSDIDILAKGDYRCTGIAWRINLGGSQTMHWYDTKMLFVDNHDNHKRNNSFKVVQVPQTFAESFDIAKFELARAPEYST